MQASSEDLSSLIQTASTIEEAANWQTGTLLAATWAVILVSVREGLVKHVSQGREGRDADHEIPLHLITLFRFTTSTKKIRTLRFRPRLFGGWQPLSGSAVQM